MPKPSDIANRYQILLEGLKAGEAEKFAVIADEIGDTLLAWLGRLKGNKLSGTSRREFVTATRQLAAAMNKTMAGAGDELLRNAEQIGIAGANFELKNLAQEIGSVQVKPPTTAGLRKAVFERGMAANGKTLTDWVTDWVTGQPPAIVAFAQQAFEQGLTIQEMTQRIRGTRAGGFTDGLIAAKRREAEAIARTTVQHAASAARQKTWEENDDIVTGYQFVATLDGRTTRVCRALDGKKFKLGEGPIPPVHINCRSTTIAVLDPALDLDFLDEGALRSSKGGYVPANLTYHEWLKTQSSDFQDQVLGKKAGKVFRDGGLTSEQFAALGLNKDFSPRTLKEMQALEPLAFSDAGVTVARKKPVDLSKVPTVKPPSAPEPPTPPAVPTRTAADVRRELLEGHATAETVWPRRYEIDRAVREQVAQASEIPLEKRKIFYFGTVPGSPADQAVKGGGPEGAVYSEARGWLGRNLHGDFHKTGLEAVQIILDTAHPRGAYLHSGNGFMLMPPGAPVRLVIHEYVHSLEHKFPEVIQASRDFLAKRAGTELPQSMNLLTGQTGYHASEVAFDDEFAKRGSSAYAGKLYSPTGKIQDVTATELLTMGAERLYADPVAFAREDPDYFDFVISVFHKISR